MSVVSSPTVTQVLDEELQQVETSRNLRLGPDVRSPAQESLIGLAFSGGGIRSATFNLGVLQGLACSRLLRVFDYLSTVSGGGYIGGWLMAWMHHQQIGIQQVEEKLSAPPDSPRESADPPEVHFLRDYSNYLTPRKGLLGADFWAFAASYIRNTLLNQVILILMLLSLLMLPRSIVYLLHLLEKVEVLLRGKFSDTVQAYMESQYFALLLGLVLASLAVAFVGMNLVSVDPHRKRRDCWFTHQWAVQTLIVVPLFLAAALFTYGLGQFLTLWRVVELPLYRAPLLGIALYFGLWAFALAVRSIVRASFKTTGNGGPKVWLLLATAAVTGAICGYFFVPFSRILIPVNGPPGFAFTKWHVMTFGTPVAIAMMLIAGVLHIGLMGRGMTDAHREWWGRLGGWMVIYGFCWFFLFLISVYFPAAMGNLLRWEQQHNSRHLFTSAGVLVWSASTTYGVLFGNSDRNGKSLLGGSFRQKLPQYLAKVTPYVFILGFVGTLAADSSDLSTHQRARLRGWSQPTRAGNTQRRLFSSGHTIDMCVDVRRRGTFLVASGYQ